MNDYQAEIISIEIDLLVEHPSQAIVYEDKELEADFIASIKERGVLQPLIVASNAIIDENGDIQIADDPSDPNIQYIVVSGHRRLNGANLAGLTEVPCILKQYEIPEEIKADFLLSNQYRVKTKKEITNEYLQYKQLLCQVGKVRQTTNTYAGKEFKIAGISRILETLNLDINDSLNTVKIIKEKTGLSKYEQEQCTVIHDDDYQGKKLDKLYELGLSAKDGEAICTKWAEVRESNKNGEVSDNEASDALKQMLTEIENRLKPKKAKEPKIKKAVVNKKIMLIHGEKYLASDELQKFNNWLSCNPDYESAGRVFDDYEKYSTSVDLLDTNEQHKAVVELVNHIYDLQRMTIELIKSADAIYYCDNVGKECSRVKFCGEVASILGKKIISI